MQKLIKYKKQSWFELEFRLFQVFFGEKFFVKFLK